MMISYSLSPFGERVGVRGFAFGSRPQLNEVAKASPLTPAPLPEGREGTKSGSCMISIHFQLDSPAQTLALGRALGERLFPGTVLALTGELGAGKTLLTRGIAEGLNVANSAAVNSPTFVLIQEYPARLPIYHFDVYRLQSVDEFLDLGSDEYLSGDGVSIIEWANRVTSALPGTGLRLRLKLSPSRCGG